MITQMKNFAIKMKTINQGAPYTPDKLYDVIGMVRDGGVIKFIVRSDTGVIAEVVHSMATIEWIEGEPVTVLQGKMVVMANGVEAQEKPKMTKEEALEKARLAKAEKALSGGD